MLQITMTLIRFIHPFKNIPVTGVLRGKKMCSITPYPTFIVRYSEDEHRPPHDLHISQRDIIELPRAPQTPDDGSSFANE
jgi:hypothetical protein